MVKIAFDNQIFLEQKFGGISRYFCEVFSEIKKNSNTKAQIIAPLHFNRYLKDLKENGNYYVLTSTEKLRINSVVHKLSNQISESRIQKFKPDIVHKTFFYKPEKSIAKSIVTVHDMIHEIFNQNPDFVKFKKLSILNADHIICISENTKIDLLNYYKVNEKKVTVVPLGVGKYFFDDYDLKPLNQRNSELVFIGRRKGYKNFELFLQAFAKSVNLKKNFKIVVFGGGALTKREQILIKSLKIEANIVKKDGGDKVLQKTLSTAVAMVYPSKYEGFGLPIIEAMALGCLVFTSNTSSMPEVGGIHARYFDPDSVYSMQSILEDGLISNPNFSDDFQLNGILWARKFSWDNCATKTLKIYESLA
jgi:glycosyltransferase involved in cell wall biosynthesis